MCISACFTLHTGSAHLMPYICGRLRCMVRKNLWMVQRITPDNLCRPNLVEMSLLNSKSVYVEVVPANVPIYRRFSEEEQMSGG
jgi:hypothetical protein